MLYLVATPIGNLGDISERALETLRQADLVASEDTRKTGRLLRHFEIDARQVAFHEHNEQRVGERLIAALHQGSTVALVSNAGTPVVSDPGFTLVRRALAAGIEVSMVPGPTAFVMALVLSGLPAHGFTFRGFPPRKPGARRRYLAVDAESPHTLVFYESPYRVEALLRDALEVYGDRPAAVARELTKRFESVTRGRVSELLEGLAGTKPRGEFTVVIGGAGTTAAPTPRDKESDA